MEPLSDWDAAQQDPSDERRVRALALPLALGLSFAIAAGQARFLVRTFVTMWLHELGHAAAAWAAGFVAFPLPWRTPMGDHRSPLFALLLALGLGALAFRRRSPLWGVLLALQLSLTLALREERARALITFAGDGGALVFGALLMASVYAGPDSALRKGALRFGLLGLGALAFADTFLTWWRARTDESAIPFGEIEGVGLSDPSRLTELHGMGQGAMVGAYVKLGLLLLAALAALYAVQLARRHDRQRR